MRRLIALCSVKGSPGVTTLAAALAVRAPVPGMPNPVLVEADPAGGDMAAWRGVPDGPGLLDLAAMARHARTPVDLHGPWTRPLGDGLTVVTGPAGAAQAGEGVRLLAGGGFAALRGDAAATGLVLADAGRLAPAGRDLVGAADVVVLVCRGGVDALAHVAAEAEDLKARARRLHLAVVGPCPYPAGEIGRVLGVDRVRLVPWDPAAAAAVQRGEVLRGRARRAFARAVDALLADLGGTTGQVTAASGPFAAPAPHPPVGPWPSSRPATAPAGGEIA